MQLLNERPKYEVKNPTSSFNRKINELNTERKNNAKSNSIENEEKFQSVLAFKIGKVKDENRVISNPSPRVKNGSQKKNTLYNQINKNKVDTPVINLNHYSPNKIIATSKSPYEESTKSKVEVFVNKNKGRLLMNFNFKYIDNTSNKIIHSINIGKSLDKKIMAMDFNQECFKIFSNEISDFELNNIQLVILNNMGIFIKTVNENEDIVDQLRQFHEKKIFMCYYIVDLETCLNFNLNENKTLIVAHVFREKFSEQNVEVNLHIENQIRFPILIKDENMLDNDNQMRSCIYKYIRRVYDKLISEDSGNKQRI